MKIVGKAKKVSPSTPYTTYLNWERSALYHVISHSHWLLTVITSVQSVHVHAHICPVVAVSWSTSLKVNEFNGFNDLCQMASVNDLTSTVETEHCSLTSSCLLFRIVGVKTGGSQPYTWPPTQESGGSFDPPDPPGSPPLLTMQHSLLYSAHSFWTQTLLHHSRSFVKAFRLKSRTGCIDCLTLNCSYIYYLMLSVISVLFESDHEGPYTYT